MKELPKKYISKIAAGQSLLTNLMLALEATELDSMREVIFESGMKLISSVLNPDKNLVDDDDGFDDDAVEDD